MDKRSDIFKFTELSLKSYRLVSADSSDNSSQNIEPLGEGGSGIVFKAYQELHESIVIDRAIKFFMYRDDIAKFPNHKYGGPVSNDDFLSEIRNISSFSHENLISVVDAGIHVTGDYKIPFIVTDFVNGPTLRHVIDPDSTKESPRHKEEARGIRDAIENNPILALDILTKVASAINHLHDSSFYHCDIAPKNIFMSSNGQVQPILGDLGIAKDFSIDRKNVFVAASKNYIPDEVLDNINEEILWNKFKSFQPFWDLYAFSKTGLELLSLVKTNKQAWINPLIATFSQIIEGGKKYSNISTLIERLEFLQPFHRELAKVPELSPGLTGKRRNLMPVESLSISWRVSKLIHHPALLRLSSVPQITMANQLFPGANHTRYEHSLGTMETVRRYLTALLDQDLFLEHLSVEKIETALICGLLHNITRFPLSNIFHEIKSKNKEDLGSFSRESLLEEIEKIQNKYGSTIDSEITDKFPSVRYKCVKNILLGKKSEFDDEDHFIYSLINSSLDARVIDFVRRDSLHLGIIKGDVFDLDELLPHLTINNHKLALKITGVSIAEQIICLRYWLFQRVYWNSPNRKFCSMVRAIILELTEQTDFSTDFRKVCLNYDHNQMLDYLLSYSSKNNILASKDIANRLCQKDQDLYKTLLDLGQQDRSDFVSVCKKIADMNYRQVTLLEKKLETYLRKNLSNNGCVSNEIKLIIIDVPFEPGDSKLGEDIVVIKYDKIPINLKEFSGIIGGINTSFETHLRRLRVFMHPEYCPSEFTERNALSELSRKWLSDNVN
jgi:HD superfamily phosphohydrolase